MPVRVWLAVWQDAGGGYTTTEGSGWGGTVSRTGALAFGGVASRIIVAARRADSEINFNEG
ncbi:MAG TPA: hypothetical protein VNU95_11235, partial [Candidatus Acidoferrales bacterium]|nr:hypothetical protein [Candidatus Acidoferrales bacterium]